MPHRYKGEKREITWNWELTQILQTSRGKLEEIKNKLREIAEAGFTHIHWCFDWDGDYLYARSEMEQIRSWMDELD